MVNIEDFSSKYPSEGAKKYVNLVVSRGVNSEIYK